LLASKLRVSQDLPCCKGRDCLTKSLIPQAVFGPPLCPFRRDAGPRPTTAPLTDAIMGSRRHDSNAANMSRKGESDTPSSPFFSTTFTYVLIAALLLRLFVSFHSFNCFLVASFPRCFRFKLSISACLSCRSAVSTSPRHEIDMRKTHKRRGRRF
jgi:hypothetical protein